MGFTSLGTDAGAADGRKRRLLFSAAFIGSACKESAGMRMAVVCTQSDLEGVYATKTLHRRS